MLKIIKRLGKLWWLFALILILSIGQVICDVSIPTLMGDIIANLQSLATKEDWQLINRLSIFMAIVALVSCICNVSCVLLSSKITAKLIEKVRLELFTKINSFAFKDMNEFSITSLLTRTTNDLTQISNTLVLSFKYLIYAPVITIAAIVLMAIKGSWQLVLLTLGGVLLLLVLVIFIIKYVMPRNALLQNKTDKVNLITRENLEGLRVVRAYNAEEFQEEKFKVVNEDLTATTRFSNRFLGIISPSIQLVGGLLSLFVYWLGAYLINGNNIDYSTIAVFSQYNNLVLVGFLTISIILAQAPRSMICANRVMEIIDHKVDIVGKEESPKTEEVGTIEFKNVSFSYTENGVAALENISFKVEKGQTIAFIGATGSGKSTLINLMPRFYDVTEGEVLVDGINVKEYKLEDLYRKFGYVPQKGYLFHDSLLNNVKLGKPNATIEEVNEALEIAQASEFVSKLKDGLDFEISQGGKNVSGGQRQRICIARALLLKPEAFIFDDSFSALDYKTDKVLRQRIKNDLKGTTNVIVAQRVGTIMDADIIVVLDNGKMVGKGTHKELLKSCEVYREIALSQLSKEELEETNG